MFNTAIDGARLTLILDRPPVNAINDEWLAQMHALLDDLETREDISVVHIRSAHKIFCAGMDVDHIRSLMERQDGADAMVADVTEFQRAFARIEALPQVIVAELNGHALGGGLELALACDIRITSRGAKIGLPEANLGLIPGAGGTQRLTNLVGRGIASRLILSGDVLDGAEAERLGIAQWSFDADAIESESKAITERIAGLSEGAIREAKQLIAAALDQGRNGFLEEREADRRLFESADTKKRIERFLSGGR